MNSQSPRDPHPKNSGSGALNEKRGGPNLKDALPSERPVLSRRKQGRTRRIGEWPYLTIALSIVMSFVIFLSTPWGTPLRERLFPDLPGTDPETLKEKSDQPPSPDKDISLQTEDPGASKQKSEHDVDKMIVVSQQSFEKAAEPEQKIEFQVLVNDEARIVRNGETLDIFLMDTLILQGINPMRREDSGVLINFVGFVGNKDFNDTDDRGYEIRPEVLLKRHSVDQKGNLYRVEATVKNQPIAEIFVRILPSPDIE